MRHMYSMRRARMRYACARTQEHRLLNASLSLTLFTHACVHAQVVTSALDATVMLTLTSFGRSGRRQAYFDSMAAAAGQSRGSDSFVSHNAQY